MTTTAMASILGRLSGGISIAVLALGMTFGPSQGARADELEATAPSPQDMIVAPIVKAVDGLAQRISQLEESVALFTASFNSQRVATRQLCVSDETGAETCITKAQLDGMLQRMAQAEVSQPLVTVAIVAPAASYAPAVWAGVTEVSVADVVVTEVSVADAVVTEVTVTETVVAEVPAPAADDAIETTPATEVIVSTSDSSQLPQEPQFTGSTGNEIDGAALVWYPEVEITIVAAVVPDEASASDE